MYKIKIVFLQLMLYVSLIIIAPREPTREEGKVFLRIQQWRKSQDVS